MESNKPVDIENARLCNLPFKADDITDQELENVDVLINAIYARMVRLENIVDENTKTVKEELRRVNLVMRDVFGAFNRLNSRVKDLEKGEKYAD